MERRNFHCSQTRTYLLGGNQASGFAFRIHEVSADFPSYDIGGEVGKIVLVVGFMPRDDELELASLAFDAIQGIRDETLVGKVREGSVDDDELRSHAADTLASGITDILPLKFPLRHIVSHLHDPEQGHRNTLTRRNHVLFEFQRLVANGWNAYANRRFKNDILVELLADFLPHVLRIAGARGVIVAEILNVLFALLYLIDNARQDCSDIAHIRYSRFNRESAGIRPEIAHKRKSNNKYDIN